MINEVFSLHQPKNPDFFLGLVTCSLAFWTSSLSFLSCLYCTSSLVFHVCAYVSLPLFSHIRSSRYLGSDYNGLGMGMGFIGSIVSIFQYSLLSMIRFSSHDPLTSQISFWMSLISLNLLGSFFYRPSSGL